MNDSKKTRALSPPWKRHAWMLAVVWTMVISASLAWNVFQVRQETLEAARIQARVAHDKDVIYRRWNAGLGGVYVPVTDETQPNPFLADTPERDITTPSGKLLTLMNPAYMTRQVHELAEEESGVRGHITSLNPIRPENAPDLWETEALQAFESGETEASSIEEMEGQEHMRMMRPLITEKGCLKCHAVQGYQEGDVRGGISVSIPMDPLWSSARMHALTFVLGHVLLWLMGLGGIVLGTRQLIRSEWEREQAAEALRTAHDELEMRVAERTAELDRTTEELRIEVAEHERAEKELLKHREQLEEMVKERTADLAIAKEQALEAQRAAEAANQTKSAFLASMSHELRTPLNSILGFTGIILQGIVGELNDEQNKQLTMVYSSASHLLGLINDILDLSKIDAGKMEIIPAEFEVRDLVRMVERMVSPATREKGLLLKTDVSEDVPPTLYSDRNRIKQVLINLLSNAGKFTPEGEIVVSCWLAENGEAVLFGVQDTGIGIQEEHLDTIFDEFTQIIDPLKGEPQGTGLGLAISEELVEKLGGEIWVESQYGHGSHFQFTIPLRHPAEPRRPAEVRPEALDPTKKLILTIEDEMEAQEILKIYLAGEGYEVIQAHNAIEAMQLARKYRPFAITLDIIMPGKDGWDILDELKQDPMTENIPVICISILDNRDLGLSLGAIEYLVKPIEREQLIKELRRLERRARVRDILIVDDDPRAVELVAQYLGEADGYVVRKAYGGLEGLSKAQESRPDLIVLDLMMPEVDGFEVIRRLKESPQNRSVPIIIVSAKKLTQAEAEYLNGNIERIISKGDLRMEELLEDIKTLLQEMASRGQLH